MFIVGFRQIQDPYYHGFAAQISFYLMLSVVPLVLLLTQLLGVFDINTETALEVILQYTGTRVSGLITSLFEFTSIGYGNIVFIIIALWAGSRASFVITRIANYTLTEGENTGRNYFIERVRAILTMLLTMVSLVAALVILCYGKVILIAGLTIFQVEDTSFVDSFWMWLRWPLGFILYFLIIGYNYYILPTVRRPLKSVVPGAIFAALGMLIVSWAYSFYTGTLAHYDLTYGALSSVIAIMMWFLLLSWVIILGVMCNKVFEDTKVPFSNRRNPDELEKIRKNKGQIYRSKFDMDPDNVNIKTIKNILANGGKAPEVNSESEEEDEIDSRKPINKQ